MRCFVTGAAGFIGANLVHELVARGHAVTALHLPGTPLGTLADIPVTTVAGDILMPRAQLIEAMRGSDWVFHLAASYHLWLRDYAPMFAVNVEGTRNVLEAAAAAGAQRIVYTSTVGCIGLPQRGSDGNVIPTDEMTPVETAQMTNPYKLSKWRAELVARELAGQGMPVVIVNPSAPVGPRDARPTPTGRVIVDFLNRAMPGYVETGLNWVHVRDVAVGHILAAERGRVGERYILGNAAGNWTLRRTFDVLSELSGVPAPRLRVPWSVAFTAACAGEAWAKVSGKPPRAPLAGVRMAKHWMWFNPAKAIRELGLPQTPPEEALRDAVEWFRANGFVSRGSC
jgi:dihydroflavonol-4-reductase